MVDHNRSEESEHGGEGTGGDRLAPITTTGEARRRRRAGRLWWLAVRAAALAVVLWINFMVCSAEDVKCLDATPNTDTGRLLAACEREYGATGDPEIGLAYAKALYNTGNNDWLASQLARLLLMTEVRSDALHLIGRIAIREDRFDDAKDALVRARDLHRAENRWSEAVADMLALGTALSEHNDFADALRMLDSCISDAHVAGELRLAGYCYLQASQTLSAVGLFKGAQQALDAANPFLKSDRDVAALEIERANRLQDEGHDAQAVRLFERALPIAVRAQRVRQVISIRLNLAYSKAEIGRVDDAADHLEQVAVLDRDNKFRAVRLHLEARTAYHRRNLPLAASLLEDAYRATQKGEEDELIQIASLRSRVSLDGGDLVTAERWARLGIEVVERVRKKQSALELRSWVLSSRREPYELLFAALARAGRAEEALLVFSQRYGRTLLEALSRRPETEAPLSLEAAALKTEELSALLSSLSVAPLVALENQKGVLDAVRSADLLALVVAEREVWRLTSTRAGIAVRRLGSFQALDAKFKDFSAHPTKELALADRLGDIILPDELVRETDEALRVVLDGPFMSLPIAALRRGGRPLIAFRPIVRSARLSAAGCTPPAPPTTRALVLADAEGDLKAAYREAGRIALLFGTTALLGSAATSQALFTSPPLDLLHIATHAQVDSGGAVLRLADGKLHAFDVWRHNITARRVVLAACDSAVGSDDEGATSLATAFLARGSDQVVATLRTVSDPGAEQVISRFYHEGGANDPVRALAAAQRALADTTNSDWPNFAVFGQDICRTTP